MQTVSTVASLRALYEGLSTPERFVADLNQVSYRFMNSQLWEGCTDEVLFATSTDTTFVLPRQFVAVLGWNRNDVPYSVFSQFHQYIEMGIGWQDPTEMTMKGLIVDGVTVTQVEPTGTFTLRVKISNAADAGKIIRFYGNDENGQEVYTTATGTPGVNLTLASPSADTTQQFTKITGIQAPPTILGRWTLWQVVSGVETQIGTYEPGEEFPQYRRYKVGIRGTPDVIRCFCRRQWTKVSAETDWVFPGCQSAYKFGFKALQLENSNKFGDSNTPNADDMWARGENELEKELAKIRGYEVPSMRIFGGPYPRWNPIVN